MKQAVKTDVATWPALHNERRRDLESRLKAVQSIPDRICNTGTKGLWTGETKAYYRNDGHKSIPSRGVRC
jgi:hypothetical protein